MAAPAAMACADLRDCRRARSLRPARSWRPPASPFSSRATSSEVEMSIFAQLLVGLIFGSGLIVSGMIDPAKVLNFLDISGRWDPSLAFVMAGAVTVTAIGYRVIL